jgi:hypothetical protein
LPLPIRPTSADPIPGAVLVIHAIAHNAPVWTAKNPAADRRSTLH